VLRKFSELEDNMKTYLLMAVLAIIAIFAIATVEPEPSSSVVEANPIVAEAPVKSGFARVVR
jgi:hypothetical protein